VNLSSAQFGNTQNQTVVSPKPLNKGVAKMYKQLSEQLSLEIKQAKLAKEICYPWELNCITGPQEKSERNPYAF